MAREATPPPREEIVQNYSKKRVGEGDVKLDKERLAQAIGEEKKRKTAGQDGDDRAGKKRKNTEVGSHDVTEEELGKSHPFFQIITYSNFQPKIRGLSNESAHG